MKKNIASILGILILAPAILLACHCCPTMQQDGTIQIQKMACHGCCPGTFEIVRDCAARDEKPAFQAPQGSATIIPALAIQAHLQVRNEAETSIFQFPPGLNSPQSPLILRI